MSTSSLHVLMLNDWTVRKETEVAAYTHESDTDVAAFIVMRLNQPCTGAVTVTRSVVGRPAYYAGYAYLKDLRSCGEL